MPKELFVLFSTVHDSLVVSITWLVLFDLITGDMLKKIPFGKKAGNLSASSSYSDDSHQYKCTIRCLDDNVTPVVLPFKVTVHCY